MTVELWYSDERNNVLIITSEYTTLQKGLSFCVRFQGKKSYPGMESKISKENDECYNITEFEK